MRRLLLAMFFLVAVASPSVAIYPYPSLPIVSASASCSDTSANTWRSAVITNSGTVSAGRYQIICNMIVNLKSDGVWSLLDRLWILAGENAPQALTDMVSTELATVVSAPTFTANLGYQASSTSSYISSTYAFNTATNYKQNSAHIFAYSNTGGLSPYEGMGASNTDIIGVYKANYSGNIYCSVNKDFEPGFPLASGIGGAVCSRTGSTTTATYASDSSSLGAALGVNTGASVAVPTATLLLLAGYQGAITGDTVFRYAAFSVGAGLDATHAAALYSRVYTALAAIGAN